MLEHWRQRLPYGFYEHPLGEALPYSFGVWGMPARAECARDGGPRVKVNQSWPSEMLDWYRVIAANLDRWEDLAR